MTDTLESDTVRRISMRLEEMQSQLKELQGGMRGRIVSTSVTIATWHGRPPLFEHDETYDLCQRYLANTADINFLRQIQNAYVAAAGDARLKPALSTDSQGKTIIVLVPPH